MSIIIASQSSCREMSSNCLRSEYASVYKAHSYVRATLIRKTPDGTAGCMKYYSISLSHSLSTHIFFDGTLYDGFSVGLPPVECVCTNMPIVAILLMSNIPFFIH